MTPRGIQPKNNETQKLKNLAETSTAAHRGGEGPYRVGSALTKTNRAKPPPGQLPVCVGKEELRVARVYYLKNVHFLKSFIYLAVLDLG